MFGELVRVPWMLFSFGYLPGRLQSLRPQRRVTGAQHFSRLCVPRSEAALDLASADLRLRDIAAGELRWRGISLGWFGLALLPSDTVLISGDGRLTGFIRTLRFDGVDTTHPKRRGDDTDGEP